MPVGRFGLDAGKRAVNLEDLAARLRLWVVALELGGLPAFLRPDAEPRSYVAGGRIAAMVELIGQ